MEFGGVQKLIIIVVTLYLKVQTMGINKKRKNKLYQIYTIETGILLYQLLIYAFMIAPALHINSYNTCYSNNFTYYYAQQNTSINFLNCTINSFRKGR